MDVDEDDATKWSAEVYFTSPNYQAKKMVFLLFINRRFNRRFLIDFSSSFPARISIDRLVESSRMKKALEAIYVNILPKCASPFVYLRYARNLTRFSIL